MRDIKYLLKILIMIISINSHAQKNTRINLINSDQIISNKKHPDYWLYKGNVSFEHDNTLMTCDSAHHYKKENKMIAFGKVIINNKTLNIKGAQLIYNGNTKSAQINNEVILRDEHATLTTSEIIYEIEENTAFYPYKGKIIDGNIILNSKQGSYNTKSNNFYFKNDVHVQAENYTVETDTLIYNSKRKTSYFIGPSFIFSDQNTIYCENGWYNTNTDICQFQENSYIKDEHNIIKGDSLFYDRNKGYGKAIKNITMIDSINNLIINGDLAEYYEKDNKMEVQEKALLNIISEDDTLFINAQRFVNINNNKDDYILAYDKVKIYKKNVQGICDSLYYNIKDSIIQLFNKPTLWSNDIQINADSIDIMISNKKINKMHLYPNPIIISPADSIDFNQISAKTFY